MLKGAAAHTGVTTAGTSFSSPTYPAAAYSFGSLPTSIASGSITVAAGQRVVITFSYTAGSPTTTATIEVVSSVVGTGDLTGLSFTAHHSEQYRDDLDEYGGGCFIYSAVAGPGDVGTGTIAVTMSGSCRSLFAQACVVEACDVIDAVGGTDDDAGTTVAATFAGTPDANDLILAVSGQPANQLPGTPTGFTSSGSGNDANNGHRSAFRNGGAGATTTFTSTTNTRPGGCAAVQLRRI